MKLENQVVSLELAKKLKELGVEQDSYFNWYTNYKGYYILGDNSDMMNNAKMTGNTTAPQWDYISAFTVAELGEYIKKASEETIGNLPERFSNMPVKEFIANWFKADYWAEILIYLLENNLINNNDKSKQRRMCIL